jgi:hypothetical protein
MDSIGVLKSDLRSPALRNDEGSLYYVCPRAADSHSLAMVQRERVFPHECGGTHAPLRVSYGRTNAGIRMRELPVVEYPHIVLVIPAFRRCR